MVVSMGGRSDSFLRRSSSSNMRICSSKRTSLRHSCSNLMETVSAVRCRRMYSCSGTGERDRVVGRDSFLEVRGLRDAISNYGESGAGAVGRTGKRCAAGGTGLEGVSVSGEAGGRGRLGDRSLNMPREVGDLTGDRPVTHSSVRGRQIHRHSTEMNWDRTNLGPIL